MSVCSRREELGGYVLDGSMPGERAAVEAHVATCPACRRELAELEALPALLGLAADSPPAPPQRMRDRVLADAALRRSRRRWTAVAAAVAVVSALLGGAVVAWFSAPASPTVAVGLRAVEPFASEGWAVLRESRAGMTVDLDIRGLDPLPAGSRYEAWLSTHDEQLVSLGELRPDGGGAVAVSLDADGGLARYRSVWVTAEPAGSGQRDGPTVVYARLPRAPR